jgi:hypothetical protein
MRLVWIVSRIQRIMQNLLSNEDHMKEYVRSPYTNSLKFFTTLSLSSQLKLRQNKGNKLENWNQDKAWHGSNTCLRWVGSVWGCKRGPLMIFKCTPNLTIFIGFVFEYIIFRLLSHLSNFWCKEFKEKMKGHMLCNP